MYGRETLVRNVTVADATGSLGLALWRDLALLEAKVGQTLEVTHCVLKRDRNGTKSLQTTQHTVIQVLYHTAISTTIVKCVIDSYYRFEIETDSHYRFEIETHSYKYCVLFSFRKQRRQ